MKPPTRSNHSSAKEFPIGLIGPEFFAEDACAKNSSWGIRCADSLLKNFPCFSYIGTSETDALEYRKMRARCEVALLPAGDSERLRPEFLEIMRDRSCLVTEETPLLRNLGFQNGIHCIFTTPEGVVEACIEVLSDARKIKGITKNAFKLANRLAD